MRPDHFARNTIALLGTLALGLPIPVVAQGEDGLPRSRHGLLYALSGHGPRNVVLIHGSNLDHRTWNGEAARLLRRACGVSRTTRQITIVRGGGPT